MVKFIPELFFTVFTRTNVIIALAGILHILVFILLTLCSLLIYGGLLTVIARIRR